MPNRIVNFQMQQPGEMVNPQTVGVQQQNRLSLAERLRKYGLGQDQSGAQSFSDAFNQQRQDGTQQPQDQGGLQTPQQQQAGQIMKSAPMSAQRGMMGAAARTGGAISRGASNAGGALKSAAAGFGKLFA